jgi:hypothetical protein
MNRPSGAVVTNCKNSIIFKRAVIFEQFCFIRRSLPLSFGIALSICLSTMQTGSAEDFSIQRETNLRETVVRQATKISQQASRRYPSFEGERRFLAEKSESPSKKLAEQSKSDSKNSDSKGAISNEIMNDITIYGVEMQEAFGRDFFTHLRLRPIGYSVTKDGFTEMLLRLPKSSQLRALLNCYVVLDDSGKIIRARLHLKRRAIEDKLQGAFARDYAKSFVQAAVPESVIDTGASIGNEIFFRQEITKLEKVQVEDKEQKAGADAPRTYFKLGSGKLKQGDIIITGGGGELPTLPKTPSEFYQVFIGKAKTSKMQLDDVVLRFVNMNLEGEDTLVISVAGKNDPEDDRDRKEVDYGNLPLHVPMI